MAMNFQWRLMFAIHWTSQGQAAIKKQHVCLMIWCHGQPIATLIVTAVLFRAHIISTQHIRMGKEFIGILIVIQH